jgi:hypothetical protein
MDLRRVIFIPNGYIWVMNDKRSVNFSGNDVHRGYERQKERQFQWKRRSSGV